MSANIETKNGVYSFAFIGDRKNIWHMNGNQASPEWSLEQWANGAGLNYTVSKVPAFALVGGQIQPVPGRHYIARDDNGFIVSGKDVSDRYELVQPRANLDFFAHYIEHDSRFRLDTAGVLKKGENVFATAAFDTPVSVAGDAHKARLLMTTSFDGSSATVVKGLMERVVCENTLRSGLVEQGAEIRTVHSTRFDAAKVRRELAAVVSGFAKFKEMGDAMGLAVMQERELVDFFKNVLDIPLNAKREEISTRRYNQYKALFESWRVTASETEAGTAWGALNAVTRYVDHERSASQSDAFSSEGESRFYSANFAGGDAMKAKAWNLLLPRIADKVAVPV